METRERNKEIPYMNWIAIVPDTDDIPAKKDKENKTSTQ